MNELEAVRVPDVALINKMYLTYLHRRYRLVVRQKRGVDYDAEYQSGTVTYYYVPYRDEQSLERIFAAAALAPSVREDVDDVVARAPKNAVPADMRGFVQTGEQYSVVPLWVASSTAWPWHMYNAAASILVMGAASDEVIRWLQQALSGIERAKYISAHKIDVCVGGAGAAVYIYPPIDTTLSEFVNMYVRGDGRKLFAQYGRGDAEYTSCTSVAVLPSNTMLTMVVTRDFEVVYERPI